VRVQSPVDNAIDILANINHVIDAEVEQPIKPQVPRGGFPDQPLEPMLLPKLRIHFADFPWSHCSIDQRLFTSESGCGDRYGRFMLDRLCLSLLYPKTEN